MSARLLLVALDGADGALLRKWSDDGTLPNLHSLCRGGSTKRLTAPAGATDDAQWASFKYASGMGEHGRYFWQQRLASGKWGMAYLDELERKSFWESLSGLGLRVGVLDLPKVGPPRPINGIHLVDWLVHGRYFGQPQSYPEELSTEVMERFGPPPPSRCSYDSPALTDCEVRDVIRNLETSVARKHAAGRHYLAADSWDLFMIGFKEAHCAGHLLWDLADPHHSGYDADRVRRLGHPYERICRTLDAAVGDLMKAAGDESAVVVFSTTDMRPTASLSHFEPELVKRVNRYLGESLLVRVIRRATRRLTGADGTPPCDRLPYNENCTALRVNLDWCPPAWTRFVSRRETSILEEIESLAWELTDVDTGRALLDGVDRPSSEQPGDFAETLPDLLLRWVPGAIPTRVHSPRLGLMEAEFPTVRPGDHESGGVLFSSNSEIAREVSELKDVGKMAAHVLGADA